MSKTPLFIRIARPTYGKWLLVRYHVRTAGYELLPHEGPYLILSNHAHVYDPFWISSSLPVHVRWVAGAYLFKNQVIKTLLGRWIGGIAKQQGRSDLQTIRDISAALKQGEVVGLFPEGTRTWDGEPLGFDEATAKLVRLFRVPVVLINLEGAYGLKPRWAKHGRRGGMTIRVVRVLRPEEFEKLPVSQILELLHAHLDFSHREWQAANKVPYHSPHGAEGLEKLLFLCPSCHGKSTITTSGNDIRCTACGLHVARDPHDDLQVLSGDPKGIDSIPKWNGWERSRLQEVAREGSPMFPLDKGILLQRGLDGRLLTLSKRFSLQLEASRMVVSFPKPVASGLLQGMQTLTFNFDAIQSMIVNAKSTVEFFHEDQLWRIRISADRSVLKYVEWYTDRKSGLPDPAEERA